ncbi:MAG TPA: PEGA domain-containing protein, partial [Polyangiales bacterium]
ATPSGQFTVSGDHRLPTVGDSTLPPPPGYYDTRGFAHMDSGVITHAGHVAPAVSMPSAGGPGLLPKLAVIAALAIAGGFLALRFAEHNTGLTAQPLPGAAATHTAPTPSSSSSERPQAHVLVRLTSFPSGATVSADGKVYGQTPADIEWWGDLASEGRRITFEFAREGFEKVTVVRELHGTELNVEATLPPSARAPRSQPSVRHRQRAEPPAPPPVITLPARPFKADPY